MTKKVILTISLTMIFNAFILAQESVVIDKNEFKTEKKGFGTAWREIKAGDKFYEEKTQGSMLQALDLYLIAYEYNANNAQLNYKIGICYLYSIYKQKSLYYLERAYELDPKIATDILWNLAAANQYNYNFDKAIALLNDYKKYVSENNIKVREGRNIDKKIDECKNGKILYENPMEVLITNIEGVNSPYPDYCPVISADESVMVFTSRREDVMGGKTDKYDGQFFEDIFISYNNDGEWEEPYNIGKPLNSNYHDATVGLSPDGQSMLVYKNGDIYICELKGENWTEPKPLPKTINTDKVENSACFSFDSKKIYFIRGKSNADKNANSDIYVSEKINGEWQEAQRLSNTINTPYDEDGVFIHPDGKTLYFSSQGHNSIGGYDIFKSTLKDDGTWTKPQNLGYPINTPDDDIYFVLSANGKTGYYSSVREEGQGFTDIYKISFLAPKPTFQNSDDNLIATN